MKGLLELYCLGDTMLKVDSNLIVVFFCITLFLFGCQSSWQQPIPNGEIIFMSVGALGFIQTSEGNIQIHKVDERFAKPVWSNNSMFLFGLSGSGHAGVFGGYPAYWNLDNGQYKACTHNSPFFEQIQSSENPTNHYEAIVMNVWEIIVIDLSNCKEIQTFVDYSDHPEKFSIAGFSYSPFKQKLTYGLVTNPYKNRNYEILVMDITNGEVEKLAEGINPVWSPDGSQIAYLGLDGLYVISSNGSEIRRLVNQPLFNAWQSGSPESHTPIPRWSPDGQWIVYHKCISGDPCNIADAQIFKVRLEDGDEEQILSGGQFPSWGNR